MLKLMKLFNLSVSVLLLWISMMSMKALFQIFKTNKAFLISWELLNLISVTVQIDMIFDWMSLLFIFSVSVITSSVLLFSQSYMSEDPSSLRFHLLVFLFVLSMYLLIISPNLISVMLGWDGLGVTSYLLVIYYQSPKSYSAGLLTALTNRLGDIGILLSVAFMLKEMNWRTEIFSVEESFLHGLIPLLIFLSSMTKSAQLPFSAWLPAAMAAPTPVSALVHSSTLVTAGIYLLIRFYAWTAQTIYLSIFLLLGSMTSCMAGLTALGESDMKKMVALSTLSQLGLMMSSLSLSLIKITYIHLLSHAYFKALLFMGAGNLIHVSNNFQDLRMMGSKSKSLPLSLSFMNLANLSLCGFPFTSGFYSKDLILEASLISTESFFSVFLFFFATFLTAAYTFRFIFLSLTQPSMSQSFKWLIDKDLKMNHGNWLLMSFSIFMGSFLSWNLMDKPVIMVMPIFLKVMSLTVVLLGMMTLKMNLALASSSMSIYIQAWIFMWNLSSISGQIWLPKISQLMLYPRKSLDLQWFYSIFHSQTSQINYQLSIYSEKIHSLKFKDLLQLVFFMLLLTLILF